MNQFFSRFLIVAALLCGFLGSCSGVRAQDIIGNGQKSEEEVKASDGWLRQMAEEPQSPVEASVLTFPSSHRVVSFRSNRLLSTHGGRPGQHHSRGTTDAYSPLQTTSKGGILTSSLALGRASSSPRLYYVIALRRLLC